MARRGASTWKLSVSAKTGHSSGIFGDELGSGAIFEAARILDAFRREVPQKYLTINPSVLVGGTTARYDGVAKSGTAEGKLNVIPARVVVEGDLRFISEDQEQGARKMMHKIIGRGLPRTEATLSFADEYPAMSPTEGNYKLLAALDRASRDLGLGGVKALDPGRRGAGDISFVAPEVDGLDGLGARGRGFACPERVGRSRFPHPADQASLVADLPAHSPLNRVGVTHPERGSGTHEQRRLALPGPRRGRREC